MPPRTRLTNKYEKYFEAKPTEWHRNIIGEYHVSAIGVGHQDLEQNEHSGPDLRDTFYEYINPLPDSALTRGNFKMGNIMHREVQTDAKANRPCIVEYPLFRTFIRGDQRIKIFGSIDLIEYDNELAKNGIIQAITLVDLKSASDWTYPYGPENLNPTHRDQVIIYAYWLQNWVFNIKVMKISKIRVVYMNKHEAYCGEVNVIYDNDKALLIWIEFINRCFELDKKLHDYTKMYKNYKISLDESNQMKTTKKQKTELRIELNGCLPQSEPHHWSKFSKYRFRSRDNVIFDEDVRTHSIEEIEGFYTEATGKKPLYRGKHTKAFETYAYGFKIDEL